MEREDSEEAKRLKFKELATQAIEFRNKALRYGSPEEAKLGLQGTAVWSEAYRTIFEELRPALLETGVWVFFNEKSDSSFVDDVVAYTQALENELELIDSYRGYLTLL